MRAYRHAILPLTASVQTLPGMEWEMRSARMTSPPRNLGPVPDDLVALAA
jgi:hypothetical protein